MDWSGLYPLYNETADEQSEVKELTKQVEFADIGCGYGGLLSMIITFQLSLIYKMSNYIHLIWLKVTLSPMFPENLIVGMEIRVKVSDYVMDRISALRHQHPGKYQNIACVRTNAMKYLPNYFYKGQVHLLYYLNLILLSYSIINNPIF